MDIANGTIEIDLGWGSIVSSTSWVDAESSMYRDLGPLFFGDIPWTQLLDFSTEAVIQEVRFASNFDSPLQVLAGLYYEDIEGFDSNWGLFGGDPSLNPFGSDIKLFRNTLDSPIEQKAIFGEVSYEISDTLTITGGARAFEYEVGETNSVDETFFAPPSITISEDSQSDVNYKAGIDYSPSDDILLYASWSQGFRLGKSLPPESKPVCDQNNDGIYDGSEGVQTGARKIDPDEVDSYEIGGKFSLLDNRVNINVSAYHVYWDGIPLNVNFDFCSTTLNAGKAETQGIEIESTFQLNENLLANIGGSYGKGELTEDTEELGKSGDRLPGAPEYNFSAGLTYLFDIAGYESFFRGDYSYVGGFYNNTQETGQEAGDYSRFDARVGVKLNEGFSVELYGKNITNSNELTWVDSEPASGLRGNFMRPRTVGVSLRYQF